MNHHRYCPERTFPAYAFVPGQHPHPVTDAQGHSFGQVHQIPDPLDPDHAQRSVEYRFAVDLFNHGYYWEAHEAWEGLWIAANRSGLIADFLKGLIKLAAAGVKSREGQSGGVQRHAKRAAELFQSVMNQLTGSPRSTAFGGLLLSDLIRQSLSLASKPQVDPTTSIAGRAVLGIQLVLASS